MKIKNNLRKNAFSLIELSIVILIIGLLVLGISKGSTIVSRADLVDARELTADSPVNSTSDLVAWYEPTYDGSFADSDENDGVPIVKGWFDNSSAKSNNATIGTVAPTYQKYVINRLPALRFDGTSSFLNFDSTVFNQKYYTIFVVEQRRSAAVNPFFYLKDASENGYSDSTTISSSYATAHVPAYDSPTPTIVTFLTGTANANRRGIFVNGGAGSVPAGTADDALLNASDASGYIGKGVSSFFNGDIAEVILFNRELTLNERNAIQEYLGKKYHIKVTPSA